MAAMTSDQWKARIAWHLGQADALLTDTPADAVTQSSRASAHARTASAISQALEVGHVGGK